MPILSKELEYGDEVQFRNSTNSTWGYGYYICGIPHPECPHLVQGLDRRLREASYVEKVSKPLGPKPKEGEPVGVWNYMGKEVRILLLRENSMDRWAYYAPIPEGFGHRIPGHYVPSWWEKNATIWEFSDLFDHDGRFRTD